MRRHTSYEAIVTDVPLSQQILLKFLLSGPVNRAPEGTIGNSDAWTLPPGMAVRVRP